MWPRPIFVLHSRSAPITQRMILPLFLFQSISFVFLRSSLCNSFFSSNQAAAFFPHPNCLLSALLFHSFIFYCLNSNRQSRPIELELFLIRTSLSASICIPLAFLPLGIYFYLFLFHPASLSLCVLVPSCLFLFFSSTH